MFGEDVQPVEQIFPEGSFRDVLIQVAVCDGYDPHVHMESADPAKALEFAVLQYS